jgi:hypothetical protein
LDCQALEQSVRAGDRNSSPQSLKTSKPERLDSPRT